MALKQVGWNIDIYERSASQLTGRGAGIVTQPELLRILTQLGLDIRNNFGVLVNERALISTAGDVINQVSFPQAVTAWDAIYAMLRAQIDPTDYHAAHELVDMQQSAASVTAHFSNGQTAESDILVGADGVRSTVRALVAPQVQPVFAGYTGWRCLADEAALPARVRERYFDRFCFHYPAGGQILSYPVAGLNNDLRPGNRRLNVVWYRPVKNMAAFEDMLKDDQGTSHKLGIPPPLIRKEIRDEALQSAAQLPEPFKSAITATDQFFFQPIYDVESSALRFSRVVLAGDAAFTARPHVGAGVTKAAADAACLAEYCRSQNNDISQALDSYSSERLKTGQAIIAETKRLGQLIGPDVSSLAKDEATANMIETATLNFLDVT